MQTDFYLLAVAVPVALAIGAAALAVVFVTLKVAKWMMKMVLMLAALATLGLAIWWLAGAH